MILEVTMSCDGEAVCLVSVETPIQSMEWLMWWRFCVPVDSGGGLASPVTVAICDEDEPSV